MKKYIKPAIVVANFDCDTDILVGSAVKGDFDGTQPLKVKDFDFDAVELDADDIADFSDVW